MKFTSAVLIYAAALLMQCDYVVALENKVTKVMQNEDSKYWSRFLQSDLSITLSPSPPPPPPPPTPGPTPVTTFAPTPEPTPEPPTLAPPISPPPTLEPISCEVDVTVSCTTSDGTDCKSIATPDGQCAVGVSFTSLTLRYKGGSCDTSSNTQADALCEDFNGGPPALEPANIVCTSDGMTYFDAEVVYGGDIIISPDAGFPVDLTCTVSGSDGTQYQSVQFDTSGDVSLFLKDKFGSLEVKVCDDIENEAKTCIFPLRYTYTFANVGTNDMTITSAEYVRNDGKVDLLTILPDKELSPGESTQIIEIEVVDICVDGLYTTTLIGSADPPGGGPCTDTDEYIFITEQAKTASPVTLTPVVPPPVTSAPAVPPPVTSAPVVPPPVTSAPVVPPPVTSAPVVPPPVTEAPVTLSPTPANETCSVSINVQCNPDGDLEGCDNILPLVTQCNQRPNELTMRYNGGDCSQSFNIQPASLFVCEDFQGGPPTEEGALSYILAVDVKGQNIVYFEGFKAVGEEYTIRDGGNRVDANMNISVYSTDVIDFANMIQTIVYHSSCSRNLFLKDRFGSSQLVGFVNDLQGNVSCFFNSNYDFTIVNSGDFGAEFVSLISSTNLGEFNLTDQVLGASVAPGESFTLSLPISLDLTVRQRYTVLSTITGRTEGSGLICSDTDFLTFVAGNPLPPIFPTASPSLTSAPV